MSADKLIIRGLATERYGVADLELPLGRLVCLRGGAGSGAQSLARDVLLGESRRRFLRALSPQDRERFGGLGLPVEMEEAIGLPPAQSLPGEHEQERVVDVLNLRADLARILHAFAATACPDCGGMCRRLDDDRVVQLLQNEEVIADRSLVIAPIDLSQPPGDSLYDELVRAGFPRVLVDEQVLRIDTDDAAGRTATKNLLKLYVVIDRLVPGTAPAARLGEAIRNARAMADGRVLLQAEGDSRESFWFNRQFSCRACGREVVEQSWDRWLDEHTPANSPSVRPEAVSNTHLAGHSVSELRNCTVEQLDVLLEQLSLQADHDQPLIARARTILESAMSLGLGSVELWRRWSRLAFGERVLLSISVAISQRLSGLLYVVIPPLSGLQEEMVTTVIDGLRKLVGLGGTVVIVDADPTVAAHAHTVIDCPAPVTEDSPLLTDQKQEPASDGVLLIRPRSHGPKGGGTDAAGVEPSTTLEVPLGLLICLDGPSGAGKTALLRQISLGLGRAGHGRSAFRVDATGIRRCIHLSLEVQQAGDGILMQLLTLNRDLARLFAATPAAVEHQISSEWFELERPGGRCPGCEGRGEVVHRLEYVEDLLVLCPECEGRRFREEVLVVTIRGASMDDLLEMTVAEAARFLHREQRLHAILQVADANGLGSCRLSASVRELDDLQILRAVLAGFGGRADRRDLFIVERPGAGEDANGALQLNRALRRLTARGATVIATHAAAVTPATADWLLCMERSEGAECGLVVTCKAASATA